MAEVIYLSEMNVIPPKTMSGIHMSQRFSCTFDPNAPEDKRWMWLVDFTRVYKFYGSAPSLARAQQQARRQIEKLIKAEHRVEESE
jgi:hypothetical protein